MVIEGSAFMGRKRSNIYHKEDALEDDTLKENTVQVSKYDLSRTMKHHTR